jgi:alkyl hydroperoxide reductase subunit AhpF
LAVLGERERDAIRQMFAAAVQPVEVRLVVPGVPEPGPRSGARGALHELAELVPLVSVREFGSEQGRTFVERVPGAALFRPDGTDLRIRFAGPLGGFEFQSLVQAVADAAGPEPALAPATREALGTLGADVHILVFSTPT